MALPIAAGGLTPLRSARPAPAQRNQARESILELKTWRKRNKGSKRIDIRESQSPLFIPNTKRTSHKRGSLALSEFVPKNRGFPIWRNAFGAKNVAQAKQRVEAYLNTRESTVIRSQHKMNLPQKRFVYAFGIRSEKPRVPDLAQ